MFYRVLARDQSAPRRKAQISSGANLLLFIVLTITAEGHLGAPHHQGHHHCCEGHLTHCQLGKDELHLPLASSLKRGDLGLLWGNCLHCLTLNKIFFHKTQNRKQHSNVTTLDDMDVDVQPTVWEILKLKKRNMVLVVIVKML